MIYETKGEEVSGMVLLITKFFYVKGNASTFVSDMEENTVLIQKKTPQFKGSFIGLTTDPVYVEFTPRNLIDQVEQMCVKTDEMSEEAMRRARDYNLDFIELEHIEENMVQELLGEPLALPAAVIRKATPGTVMGTPAGEIFLGIDMERKPLKEAVKNFGLTVIEGQETHQATQVVIEGQLLNGVSGMVFDDNNEFARMGSPNKDVQGLKQYGSELDPLSMPIRKFTPGTDVFIDLGALNEKLFADIAGFNDETTIRLIGEILEKKKAKNLGEIANELSKVTDEEKRYYAARGARICRLLDDIYPDIFNGPPQANELIAPWMKRIGRLAHIDISGLDERVSKGVIYSTMKTVYETLKKETSSEEIKLSVIISKPGLVSGKGDYIDKEISALAKLATTSGIGICIRTKESKDIDKDFTMNATAKVNCIEEDQISVQTQGNKPYRVHLRPTMSSP